jgi:hypothetical protein
MDPDLNKYDLEHLVSRHQTMTDEEFTATYREVWDIFYSPDHVERIMRRGAAAGIVMPRLLSMLWVYSKVMAVEGLHPLQGGLIRRKARRDRRASFPIEPAWSFYPRYVAELVGKQAVLAGSLVRLDPERKTYTDDALTPVTEADAQSLELFTHSEDAKTAVEHTRKIAGLTAAARPSVQLGV